MKPQAVTLAPLALTDFYFGPEGQFADFCGKILDQVPESARKFTPVSLSGRKIRFQLAAVLQAVADGNKMTYQGQRQQGVGQRLPSFPWD